MCLKNQYVIPPAARAKLLLGLQWLYDHRDEHFGNGRTVRNLFELSIRRLANRIANISRLTRDQLTVLDPDDMHLTGVPPEQLADLTGVAAAVPHRLPRLRQPVPGAPGLPRPAGEMQPVRARVRGRMGRTRTG